MIYLELYVKDRSFKTIGVIDEYTSLIWTKRYWEYGDFEIYVHANIDLLNVLQIDNYICRNDDDTVMIIEKIQITTDAESGNFFVVTGRSAESILERRVITKHTWSSNFPSTLCRGLISNEFMNNSGDSNRIVSELKKITDTITGQTSSTITYRNFGETVYNAVFGICKQYGLSVKIVYDSDLDGFSIIIWQGLDRTDSQTKNSQVVFSPEFDNLVNSEYLIDYTNLKTEAFVAGAGEGNARITQWRFAGYKGGYGLSGIDRREMYVDARDISKTDDEGQEISYAEYIPMLSARGDEKLSEQMISNGFSGVVESGVQFVYKKDWNLGDIVQISNEYGISGRARILEIIESDDTAGYKITPTLSDWEVNCCD